MSRLQGFAGFMILSAACAEIPSDESDLTVSSTTEAVQTDWRQARHYEVATSMGDDLKVTGAVIMPLRDGTGKVRVNSASVPLRASCGVTFISPHYAVTAAHCVDSGSIPNPATDLLTVEQYDISSLSAAKIAASSVVTGGFPNYTRPQLTEADGYKVTKYTQCKLVQRCGDYGPRIGCNTTSDVALIHCADRSVFGRWIPVAHTDNGTGLVEMPWFHEVVDMLLDDPGPAPVLQVPEDPTYFQRVFAWMARKDRYDHYTVYRGEATADQNYHYTAQQLLPLRSSVWRTGDLINPRRKTGDDTPNLIKDGDFELQASRTLGAPWSREGVGHGVDIDLNYEYQGRKNGFIWATGGWNAMTQDIPVKKNTRYVLSAWIRNSQNFTGGYFGVRNAATNQVHAETNYGGIAQYTHVRVPFYSGELTTVRAFAGYWAPGTGSWLQIDAVHLHEDRTFDEELTNAGYTDLFGCHGTSGSGILQRNASGGLELLGPVARGSDEMVGKLCHDGSALRQGGRYLAYTRPEFVRELERTVLADRRNRFDIGPIKLP